VCAPSASELATAFDWSEEAKNEGDLQRLDAIVSGAESGSSEVDAGAIGRRRTLAIRVLFMKTKSGNDM
jgi:hypothetical protein